MTQAPLRKRAYMPAPDDGDDYLQNSDPQRWIAHHLAKARAAGRPHAVCVTIDPPLAEALLALNPEHWNRTLSRELTERWTNVMRRDEWALNGETVIIADTSKLNNGQHRLNACVFSGCSFETFVVFGVAESTRDTLDQGKRRSLRDTLEMHGYRSSANISSAAVTVLGYLKKDVGILGHSGTSLSPKQILTLMEDHPKLIESTQMGTRMNKAFRTSPAVFIALHYLATLRSPLAAQVFFESLIFQVGIARVSDPRARLVQRLRDHATKARTMKRTETVAVFVKAWNLWQRGEDVGPNTLFWRRAGGSEDLPTFNDWTPADEEALERRLKR